MPKIIFLFRLDRRNTYRQYDAWKPNTNRHDVEKQRSFSSEHSQESSHLISWKKNDYGGQSDGEKRAQFLRDRLQKQLANLGFNNDDVSEKGRCFHSLVHSASE